MARSRVIYIAIAFGVLLLIGWLWPEAPIRHAPGVLVDADPVQGPVPKDKAPWRLDEHHNATPLATFEITARVLSKEHYWFDRESTFVPYDLALGWRRMSDQSVIDKLSITQDNRFFRFRWEGSAPIGQAEMMSSATNMHLIPASPEVLATIKSVRVGQIVTLRGCLVEVVSDDGWRWKSSLTRNDTGRGACELMWVEEMTIDE